VAEPKTNLVQAVVISTDRLLCLVTRSLSCQTLIANLGKILYSQQYGQHISIKTGNKLVTSCRNAGHAVRCLRVKQKYYGDIRL